MSSAVEVLLTLDERRERIVNHLERAAVDIGEELLAAKADHPGQFAAWAARELPFSIDKAEKLMAVARAIRTLPAEVRSELPATWTVLVEVQRLGPEAIEAAVAAGVLTPRSTRRDVLALRREGMQRSLGLEVKEAPFSKGERRGPRPVGLTADSVARELIRRQRTDLTPAMERLLREWLDEGDPDG